MTKELIPSVVLYMGNFIYGPFPTPHQPKIHYSILFSNASVIITFLPSPYYSMDFEELCKAKGWDMPRIYQQTYIAYKEEKVNAPTNETTE